MVDPASKRDLSLVVPCFNEELNIPELAERVLRTFEAGKLNGELVLVDDGSRDATARVIREKMQQWPDVVVGQFHPKNRGLAAAWRTGVDAARGAAVAVLDADLQYQPEDVLRLYRTLREYSVDVVQGWRSTVGREKGKRYYLSRGFNTLLNSAFGMSLHDNKSGFVCCAKEVMQDLLTYHGEYYYWQSFIMVAAHAKGYSYREIETLFENRKQGTSFLESTAYRATARSFLDLGKAVWEYRVQRRPRDEARQFLERNGVPVTEPPSRAAYPLRWRSYMATFGQTHWTITSDVEHYYETLNTTQWLPPSQMRELQDEKLRRLVRHAYRSVPYYRVKMQELGLRPEDIRTQGDLHKLPFLTKNDVRRHLHFDMLQEGVSHADILKISTSGSTGEPFICYADRPQLEFRWAATLRSQEWTGYRFGDPTLRLWHQTIGMSKSQAAKEHADAAFANRTYVPVFEMTEDSLEAMIRLIEHKRPVLIDGYAEAFDFLAQYIDSRGGLSFKPKALMSSAQTLPRKSREVIERAFGCKVYDKYGSREFSGIAYESDAHDGHLVVAEGYIVELLVDGRPARPGEVGEVVVTDLNNHCMPFIRYRIGDLAEAMSDAPSACGRGLPRIGDIQGRVQSIIQGTEGRFVPGTFFAHALKEYDYAIKRFQVVQEERGAIRFLLVKGGRYSDDTLEEVKALIRKILGETLRIDVEFVENIEMVHTGKRLASVSKLPIDFQKRQPEYAVDSSKSMNGAAIVVTGSEGFVGKHLRRALQNRGIRVVGVDKPGSGAEVEQDLSDPRLDAGQLARRCGDVSGVIYMAATITRGSSVDAAARSNLRTIAQAPVDTFEAFREGSPEAHFVYCSTYKGYGKPEHLPIDPECPPQRPDPHSYGSAKALAERLLAIASRRLQAPYAVVRPTCIYGPGQHLHNAIPLFLRALWSGKPPVVFGSGQDVRDDVFAPDLSECLIEACLRKATGAFHATGESAHSILDVAKLCCQAVSELGGPSGLQPVVDPSKRPKWWLDQVFDWQRSRELLGYRPTPLLEGLKREARWLKDGAEPGRAVDYAAP